MNEAVQVEREKIEALISSALVCAERLDQLASPLAARTLRKGAENLQAALSPSRDAEPVAWYLTADSGTKFYLSFSRESVELERKERFGRTTRFDSIRVEPLYLHPPANDTPRVERQFPVLHGGQTVPWDFVAQYEPQAKTNHSQSLEELAKRGGLAWHELWYVINGYQWGHQPTPNDVTTKQEVLTAVREWEASKQPPHARNDEALRLLREVWERPADYGLCVGELLTGRSENEKLCAEVEDLLEPRQQGGRNGG